MPTQCTARTLLDRIYLIAALLRANQPFNATDLVNRFACTSKTIQRDMEFMRSRLRYSIIYDRRRRRYVLLAAPTPQL